MPDSPNGGRSRTSGRMLAIGLGTVLAVWSVMYVTAMPAGIIPVWVGGILVILCLIGGGYVGGRRAGFTPKDGLALGALVTVISLIVLLSLLGKPSGELARPAVWWILSFLAVSCVFAAAGAAVGQSSVEGVDQRRDVNWTHALAMVTATATLLMIISGGIVTGLEAGLAIDGWLTADGHVLVLFPVELMTGDTGKFAEHAHRLWGLLVGLSTILLAVHLWRTDDRLWVRRLGIILVLVVIVQGVMGGTRVTEESVALAIIHGVFGQLTFALIATMAAFTSTAWQTPCELPQVATADTDRRLSIGLPIVVLLQVTLGVLYRKLGKDYDGMLHPIMHGHILVAMFVLVTAILVGGRAWSRYKDRPALHQVGKWVLIIVGVQFLLGVVALGAVLWDEAPQALEVIITTLHQATGALILALSCVLVVWAYRVLPASKRAATAEDKTPHS